VVVKTGKERENTKNSTICVKGKPTFSWEKG
jgi:hypothetical protein